MEAEPQGELAATPGWRLCTLGGAWGLRETRRGAERRPRVGGTEQGPAWERPRGTRKAAGQDAKDGRWGDGARDRGLGHQEGGRTGGRGHGAGEGPGLRPRRTQWRPASACAAGRTSGRHSTGSSGPAARRPRKGQPQGPGGTGRRPWAEARLG